MTKHSLQELWELLSEAHEKQNPTELPLVEAKFEEKSWATFDAIHNASILLDHRASFPGHKQVIFAGYCTWAILPSKTSLIKSSIINQAARLFRDAETKGKRSFPTIAIGADFVTRNVLLSPHFIEHIYYGVGGLHTFAQAYPANLHARRIRKAVSGIENVLLVMRIFHYYTNVFSHDGEYRPLSLNMATDMVVSLGGNHQRTVKKDWAKFKSTICLIYAASSLDMDDGESLLDFILSAEAKYDEHHALFDEWIARARYITLRMRSLHPDLARTNIKQIAPHRVSKFEPRPFNEIEVDMINDQLIDRPTSGGVG